MKRLTQKLRSVFPAIATVLNGARSVVFYMATGFFMLQPNQVLAQPCNDIGGWVVSVEGDLTVADIPTQMGEEICSGNTIMIGQLSRAAIRLADTQTVVRADQNSVFVIEPSDTNASLLKLLKGVLYLFSRHPETLRVETPYVNAAIDGTEFVIETSAESSEITVIEGHVRVSNEQGSVRVAPGEVAYAGINKAPQRRTVIDSVDAVQWALYYPPIGAAENTSATVRSAAESLARGDVERAEDLLSASPEDSASLALKAIIAVTRNQPIEALQLAQQAVSEDPDSSLAYSALSYAQQAGFDIDQALTSATVAVRNDPSNANALARQAELQLGVDETTDALVSASQAVRMDPKNSRAHTILGFVYLVRLYVDKAEDSFSDAVDLDPGDPLSRLGLGLVLIRQGELTLGREELEIAVGLDPGYALLRSYLGKAYFEERLPNLASEQYALAKQFDSSDPTAYYYDALLNQANHQPAGALEQLRQAIALNDRRAVYRSRLLLDEDRAVRGASLAQIYDNLGFRKLALNEASKSLSADSSSYSAHRFLSDSYAQFDRREIARSSALLQAQLLQPLNSVPLQPRLAGNNLNITLSERASGLSYNEYTSMFERNETNVTGNANIGSQKTLSDELILSGRYNRLSYSLGQFHYETDGFRVNNDVEHDIYNAFLQYELNNSTGIQAEYRSRDSTQGDIAYNFELNDFELFDRRDSNEDTLRIGLRKNFNPDMTMVSSLMHIERAVDSNVQSDPVLGTNEESMSDGFDGQVQLLYSGKIFDHIAGAGWYKVKNDQIIEDYIVDSGTAVPFDFSNDRRNTDQYNSYFYANFLPIPRLVLQMGASYDRYDDERLNISDVNVKFSASLELSDNVDLRGAAFTTTKKALVADQTLEPIQLAGFNQFFDDPNGTQSTVLGLGIDSEISRVLLAGAEIFHRKLDIPIIDISTKDQNELTAAAYVYRIINSNWSATIEPIYERVESDRTSLLQVDTFSIPAAIRYFSASGFYGELELNFVNHENRVESVTEQDGGDDEVVETNIDDDFVMTNAIVGYRLPKRHGEFRLEIRNMFNQSFNYQDLNPFKSEPRLDNRYPPERQVFATIKLFF